MRLYCRVQFIVTFAYDVNASCKHGFGGLISGRQPFGPPGPPVILVGDRCKWHCIGWGYLSSLRVSYFCMAVLTFTCFFEVNSLKSKKTLYNLVVSTSKEVILETL